MRIDEDEIHSPDKLDLLFESLARLAGTLEADKAIRRSRATPDAPVKAAKKKFSSPLDVRNDNTIYSIVNNENDGGSDRD